ncbi:hypothetical protein ACLOAV_000646 [Pseudogymnoascus australis]
MPQSRPSYAHFLSTSSPTTGPDRPDSFDPDSHIHVTPSSGIFDCPPHSLDDRFGTCFRLKEQEGEWGRERIWGGGVTKGDLLGVGVVIGMVGVAWAAVGALGWVLRRRRRREGWRRGGRGVDVDGVGWRGRGEGG